MACLFQIACHQQISHSLNNKSLFFIDPILWMRATPLCSQSRSPHQKYISYIYLLRLHLTNVYIRHCQLNTIFKRLKQSAAASESVSQFVDGIRTAKLNEKVLRAHLNSYTYTMNGIGITRKRFVHKFRCIRHKVDAKI